MFVKTNVKTFLLIVSVVIIIIVYFNTYFLSKDADNSSIVRGTDRVKQESEIVLLSSELKYILIWTNPKNGPLVYMGEGQQGFIEKNCTYCNCFVTSNKNYLGSDYSKFDVVAFAGPEVVRYTKNMLPETRSAHQKYVFASIESAANYPLNTNILNGFFNWTWTYKLDSDSRWGYVVVRDLMHNIIGPKKEMHWIKHEDMDPVRDELIDQLRNKSKAAAWFVSNCHTRNKRESFVKDLQKELVQYDLTVDVYGQCGPLRCGRERSEECAELIERDYYFYLSFENSFSEDYVTEKLIHPLQNNAVPIVFGGANYTRFMPDGMYLDARKLGVKELSKKMYELIKNKSDYLEYFRWKNHYYYHRRNEYMDTNDYCKFCKILNNDTLMKTKTVYDDMRDWWSPHDNEFYKT